MLARVLLRAPLVPQGFSLLQEHVRHHVHLIVPTAQVLHNVQLAQLGIICQVPLVRAVPLVVLPAFLDPVLVLNAM